jgi:hypothetical protein
MLFLKARDEALQILLRIAATDCQSVPHDRTSIRCRAVDTKFRQSFLIAAFDAFETSAVAYDVIQIRESPHRFVFKSFARASVHLARRVCIIFDRLSSDSE